MGSKIGKGFIFYLLLLLGVVLGAFLICVVLMIFVPDFSIFGLRYFRDNQADERIVRMAVHSYEGSKESKSALMTDYEIKDIEITGDIHTVRVFKSNNLQENYDQFVVIYNSKTSGFAVGETAESTISVKYISSTKTLKIDATGPDGFLKFGESASISLQIPPSMNTEDMRLSVNTERSITIGDSSIKSLNSSIIDFRSLKLTAGESIFVTKNATIGKKARDACSFISKNGDITVEPVVRASAAEVQGGESIISFNENGQAFDIYGSLDFKTEGSFFHLGSIKAGVVTFKNKYGKVYMEGDIDAAELSISKLSHKCDYEFKKVKAILRVGSSKDSFVEGGSLSIEELNGDGSVLFTGNVNIGKTNGITNIKTKGGDINLEHISSSSEITANTIDGNITLGTEKERVLKPVSIQVEGRGKVLVYFGTFQTGISLRESKISTKSGEIEVNLLKNMNKNITATTKAKLTYLGVEIEEKTGQWEKGNVPPLVIDSDANITVVNK